MQKWEYIVVPLPRGQESVSTLNLYGKQGWELVALNGDGSLGYFKRPKK